MTFAYVRTDVGDRRPYREHYMEIFQPRRRERRAIPAHSALNDARARLQQDVRVLAHEIGERHWRRHLALEVAGGHVERSFAKAGLAVEQHGYLAGIKPCHNVIGEIRGRALPDEVVVIGAHYDSARGTPGANANASGVAALLELARRLRRRSLARTLRFVAFATSEGAFHLGVPRGSRVYARRCAERGENVQVMISLECLGYFPLRAAAAAQLAAADGTPRSPEGGAPSRRAATVHKLIHPADRRPVALVSNLRSRRILRVAQAAFGGGTEFPSCALALPGPLPYGRPSDHRSFWKEGYRALMVTDAAWLRYPYFHSPDDTPEKLDYAALAAVVAGIEAVVMELGGALLLDDLLH